MIASDSTVSRTGRDLFWAKPPPLPRACASTQLESIVVPRRGRGGESVFDIARLQTPSASALLVIAFRSPATSKDALAARDQLRTVVDDLRRRSAASATAGLPYLPVLATEVATQTVIDACVREGLGVIDRRGTLILHGGPVYVHVEGNAPVERASRIRLFSGKACRIVRALLAQPGQRLRPADLAIHRANELRVRLRRPHRSWSETDS